MSVAECEGECATGNGVRPIGLAKLVGLRVQGLLLSFLHSLLFAILFALPFATNYSKIFAYQRATIDPIRPRGFVYVFIAYFRLAEL